MKTATLIKRTFSLKKLIKAKAKYELELDLLSKKLEPYIEFEFFIMYQPSDGHVIVHKEKMHNAPLTLCLKIIKNKSKLSYEDYISECI